MSSHRAWPEISEGIPVPAERTRKVTTSELTLSEVILELMRLRQTATDDLDLDVFLNRLVQSVRLLLSATGTAVALRDKQHCSWRAGSGEPGPPIGGRLYAGRGISGGCLATGKAQLCQNTSSDLRVDAEFCRQQGIGSMIVAPIMHEGRIEGILEAWSSSSFAFGSDHSETLQKLANFAGRAAGLGNDTSGRPMSGRLLASVRTLAALGQVLFWKAVAFGTSTLRRVRNLRPLVAEITPPRNPHARRVMFTVVLAAILGAVWYSVGTSTRSSLKLSEDGSMRVNSADIPLASPFGASSSPNQTRQPRGAFFRPVLVLASRESEPMIVSNAVREWPTPVNDVKLVPLPVPGTFSSWNRDASVANSNLSLNPLAQYSERRNSPGLNGGELRHEVPPKYPGIARSAGIEGTVVLEALIDEKGRVQELTIKKGTPVLARAAVDAVKQWRYQPYLFENTPVRATAEISIRFRLR